MVSFSVLPYASPDAASYRTASRVPTSAVSSYDTCMDSKPFRWLPSLTGSLETYHPVWAVVLALGQMIAVCESGGLFLHFPWAPAQLCQYACLGFDRSCHVSDWDPSILPLSLCFWLACAYRSRSIATIRVECHQEHASPRRGNAYPSSCTLLCPHEDASWSSCLLNRRRCTSSWHVAA